MPPFSPSPTTLGYVSWLSLPFSTVANPLLVVASSMRRLFTVTLLTILSGGEHVWGEHMRAEFAAGALWMKFSGLMIASGIWGNVRRVGGNPMASDGDRIGDPLLL